MAKKIALTKDKEALVDDEDYEELSKYKWISHVKSAARSVREGEKFNYIFMHRQITECGPHEVVVHLDGDRLNNTRANLAKMSKGQRQQRCKAKTSTGFRGVHARNGRYAAAICIGLKSRHLGRFATAEEAARAYDAAAREHLGVHALTNFSEVAK